MTILDSRDSDTIIRPRLTDYYGIPTAQAQLDFAIPFLDEDIPLYVDPFLLWASPSLQDNSLHTMIVNSFNHLGHLARQGDRTRAAQMLIALSECNEVGLGTSRTRHGKPIGLRSAENILTLFDEVPTYAERGFVHFEEIQFFVDQIAKDRISDFTCSFLKSFLIDYTIDQCKRLGIPLQEVQVPIFEYKKHELTLEKVTLPANPENGSAILFVPKRWLRFNPWLDFDEYFKECVPADRIRPDGRPERVEVLTFNRHNYGMVRDYVLLKERTKLDCHNDPLFKQIPITSAKASFNAIRALATGTAETNDKKYEREAARLMASLLYPHLDFADTQSRTDGGVLIRDLIFYNNRSHPLLSDVWEKYESRQIVFELKNVKTIDGSHVNQLNRYLTGSFGRFGILLTRSPLKSAAFKNTVDLWSGQRRCILAIADDDLELMVNLYEGKQRDPIDVVNRKYVEFMRQCPS